MGLNRYNPCSVLTLDNSAYSQFLKQILFLNFGHNVTIMLSFDLPCNLCPVDVVFMLTGNRVILPVKNSRRLQFHVGFTVMMTLSILGVILNLRSFSSFGVIIPIVLWLYLGHSVDLCWYSSDVNLFLK